MIVFKKLPEPLDIELGSLFDHIPETDERSTITNLIFFDEEIYFPTYQKEGEYIYLHSFNIFFGNIHNDPCYKIPIRNMSEVYKIGHFLTYEDVLSHFEGVFECNEGEFILCDGQLFNKKEPNNDFNPLNCKFWRKK